MLSRSSRIYVIDQKKNKQIVFLFDAFFLPFTAWGSQHRQQLARNLNHLNSSRFTENGTSSLLYQLLFIHRFY